MPLDFDRLRQVNMQRAREFFNSDHEKWTLLERAGEMCGEAGEAANVAKKLRRGWKMKNGVQSPFTREERQKLLQDFADELADVIITTDLCAGEGDIDLGEAVIRKFNEKSEKWNTPHRL